MAIEHDYFGVIGDYWAERVDAGDQEVEVVLDADPDTVNDESLDVAAAMIGDLERLDGDAREAFVSELASVSSPTSLYLTHLAQDVAAESIDEVLSRESGDRQIDILRSLELLRVDFRPANDGDEESFAVFEYALVADETDARLEATLDVHGDVVNVDAHV
ncbi:DUF2004 domain-containing protein [Agromyces atrinae]|uniref:DUF2004 domain-containing protein n=1 Tax=Agromyces atrinae TaxID=592376 RepID=UPI001F5699AC|nr:DUF2004 domain-containing protein [Agromyces atrinae]MCI2959045.1 DUF2004 domain-containing protein [Agromyces atrinae]